MKKILSASLISTVVLCSLGTASAETIDHYTYTIGGFFENATFDHSKRSNVTVQNDYLKWGDKNRNYSFLEINDSSGSSNVSSDSDTALVHKNSAINADYKSLTGASLSLDFDLNSFNGITLDLEPLKYEFDFVFTETLNSKKNSNDIFAVITNTFNPIRETSFLYGDDYYLLSLALEFDTYTHKKDTYYGFSTAEGDMSMLDFTWTITRIDDSTRRNDPNPTPEPATMLLMGMGLAGMGYVKRRKK